MSGHLGHEISHPRSTWTGKTSVMEEHVFCSCTGNVQLFEDRELRSRVLSTWRSRVGSHPTTVFLLRVAFRLFPRLGELQGRRSYRHILPNSWPKSGAVKLSSLEDLQRGDAMLLAFTPGSLETNARLILR